VDGQPLYVLSHTSPLLQDEHDKLNAVQGYSNEKKRRLWLLAMIIVVVNVLVTVASMASAGVLTCGSGLTAGYFYNCQGNPVQWPWQRGCFSYRQPSQFATSRAFIVVALISVVSLLVLLFLSSRSKFAHHALRMLWACVALALFNCFCNLVALPSLATASGCSAPYVLGGMQILDMITTVPLVTGLAIFACKKTWYMKGDSYCRANRIPLQSL